MRIYIKDRPRPGKGAGLAQADHRPGRHGRLGTAPAQAGRYPDQGYCPCPPFANEAQSGRIPSIPKLAEKEKISSSYLARILRLTLLTPDFVEAILDGRQPKGLALADFLELFPVEWEEGRRRFGFDHALRYCSNA